MLANHIIQTSMEELKNITKVELNVYDPFGREIAITGTMEEIKSDIITAFAHSPADSQVVGKYHLLKVYDDQELMYVLVAKGSEDNAYTIGRVAVCQLQNLLIAYKDKYDKNNFFQDLILDNMLQVDVYNRAKKLHIDEKVMRTVFLVETKGDKDSIIFDVLKGIFSEQAGDYITSVDENNIILIKATDNEAGLPEMEEIARTIVDTVEAEAMSEVRVAFGMAVQGLIDVSKSYKEAKMAMDVGKIFYIERKVVAYSTLGIGRLIYQLDSRLCYAFMKEIFGEEIPEELDEETLHTVNKFFENNLNVSETSRQLFVHRNTLVYRIEKLQKSTGLDLRNFDDALTFKIALMVANFVKYMENKETL